MERIRKTIPERPVRGDLARVVEHEVLPVVRQLRDGFNQVAPAGEVTIEGTDLYRDVVFDAPEPDADFSIEVSVQGITGTPPAAARRVRCSRKDIYGCRVELQFRPGTGNSVTVAWGMRR